jgi:hypothetical protein
VATSTPRKRAPKKPQQPDPDEAPKLVPVSELFGGDDALVEEPVLELSLLEPVRATVNIKTPENRDGKLYELAEMNDFGLLDQYAIKRDGALFVALWNKPDLNSTEKKKIAALLEDLFDRALRVDPEDDIRSRLTDGQKTAVVLAFQTAPIAKAMAQLQKDQENEEARDDSTTAS